VRLENNYIKLQGMPGLLDLLIFPRAYLCGTARISPDGYSY